MNDGFAWWLILVGLAIGVVVSWLLMVRIPRGESDVSAAERQEEAMWISQAIERHGGVAPLTLVDEVLELHQAYLRSPGLVDQVDELTASLPTVPAPQASRAPPAYPPMPPGYPPPPPGDPSAPHVYPPTPTSGPPPPPPPPVTPSGAPPTR